MPSKGLLLLVEDEGEPLPFDVDELECLVAYLHAVGGAAQVLAECIKRVPNVYFMEQFGAPEAIWEFQIVSFPAVVTIDAHGNSLHKEVLAASQAELAKYL